MSQTAATSWGLLITAPRAEPRVARALTARNLKYHLFKIREKGTRRGAVIELEKPAWPGYIFIEAIGDWVWQLVLQIAGVLRYATRLDRSPVLIPDADIERYTRIAVDDVLPYELVGRFRFGDKVRVIGQSSLACGHEGIYQCPARFGFSLVMMEWLGRMVPVEIADDDLSSIERRRPRGGRRRSAARRRRSLIAEIRI